LIPELLRRFSTKEAYSLHVGAKPLFEALRERHNPMKDSVLSENSCEIARQLDKWDKIVVGLITNSDDRVPGILNSFGISTASRRAGASTHSLSDAETDAQADIQFAIMSYDVGYEKPDRRIFEAAENMLVDILPESASIEIIEKLYVGDDIEKDLGGANAAGWHSILLRAGGWIPEDDKIRIVGPDSHPQSQYKTVSGQWVDVIRDLSDLGKWIPRNSDGDII
jgi:hypothetical protein